MERQVEVLRRGAVDLISEAELKKKLERAAETGKPLVVKAGFDPTAPDLHLGHTIVMNKMKQFQDFGHDVVFVVGDFTALIGDPTGKNATRPPLTSEQIKSGAETYAEQAFKILDRDRARIEFNSSWLRPLGAEGIIRLAAKHTVARMLEREDFKTRFKGEMPISVHEFLYPLLQAYDSVALNCDVELGGGDQLFNLVIGRSIQKEFGQEPQVVLTTPLLEGTDAKMVDAKLAGNKMSKSLGNYVGITEPPGEIFGKLMSITDDLMWRYYELLSEIPLSEIGAMKTGCAAGTSNPRDAKARLGAEIVTRFHGADAGRTAREEFDRVFKKKEMPAEIREFSVNATDPKDLWLPRVMTAAALTASNSEAIRAINDGGVKVDGQIVKDKNTTLTPGEHLIQKGKIHFVKVIIGG
ncbi:MAG: tyrosine--tRNA ligase [Deltaproteobacteria bacterium]|nr:tyrosine--tRNA ligase [Deltaproteobacteria bacterium]